MGKVKDAYFSCGEPKKVGGQAIIEGVMMRGENACAIAVRKSDKTVEVIEMPVKSESAKSAVLKAPIIRGIWSFGSSLALGMQALMKSAEIAGEGIEDEPSAFERRITEKYGEKKIMQVMMYISVVLAIALSIGLFMVLPVVVGGFFAPLLGIDRELGTGNTRFLAVIEGFVRIGIFLCYILLISKMRDVQRVFQYHGAEHKTINCYEAGFELTTENVRGFSRIHKRCGTSFLFIVMLISMLVFLFVQTPDLATRILSRVLFVPLIAGVSYEALKFAGRSRSPLLYVLSAPGLGLQNATTKEPDDDMLETAILALRRAVGDVGEQENESANGVESTVDSGHEAVG